MSQLIPAVCDDLAVGISVHDPETGEILASNSGFETLTGYAAAAVEGKSIGDITPTGATVTPAMFDRQLSRLDGEPRSFEWDLESADGETIRVQMRLTETTVDGEKYVLAESRDISEEKTRIERLEAHQTVIRHLHETASKSMPFEEKVAELLEFGRQFMGVEQGFLTSIAEGTQAIRVGVGPNEQLQEGASAPFSKSYCRHTIDPDTESPMTVNDALNEGWEDDPAYELFGLGCYAGSKITVDGETVGTICFADRNPQDKEFNEMQETYVELLSEWVSYELGRTERERELRRKDRAVEAAPVGITISDPDQEDNPLVYVNERYTEMTGYDESDALGRNCRFLQGEATEEEPVAKLREAVDTAEPVTAELRNYRKNGEEFWNRLSIAPVTDENDELLSFVGFQRDITEQKRSQLALERSNERLQEFAYILSHDLQEPLRMVSSYVCLLEEELDDHLDEETREYIDFAVEGAERMRGMIDGLLLYSRVETDGETLDETDTDRVLEAVETDLELKLVETDSEVVAESLPTVRGDFDQLVQLFQNLIKNAIEHGGSETTVEISATETVVGHEFAISDDGPGIPADRQDEIFGLFDKGSDSDGTGIGLAICERIVTRHDGTISVESEPGEGTTFYVELPAVE